MPPERDPHSPTSTHVHEEGIDLDRPADRVGYESAYAAPRVDARERYAGDERVLHDDEEVLELREERLVARKELRQLGEIEIRTEVDEIPRRLEVEGFREEIEIEHEPVGRVVSERVGPWEEDDVLVVPVYEEQLVTVKRLVLREHLRVRRVRTTQQHFFEDVVRRERLVVEDPAETGLVHEQYATADDYASEDERLRDGSRRTSVDAADEEEGGFLEKMVRKALQ
jgi:uncharacterized protein (TIGR02271 family)